MSALVTCAVALERQLDGQCGAILGIDVSAKGALSIAELVGTDDDFLHHLACGQQPLDEPLAIGEPRFVGFLKIGANGLELAPLLGAKPSESDDGSASHGPQAALSRDGESSE